MSGLCVMMAGLAVGTLLPAEAGLAPTAQDREQDSLLSVEACATNGSARPAAPCPLPVRSRTTPIAGCVGSRNRVLQRHLDRTAMNAISRPSRLVSARQFPAGRGPVCSPCPVQAPRVTSCSHHSFCDLCHRSPPSPTYTCHHGDRRSYDRSDRSDPSDHSGRYYTNGDIAGCGRVRDAIVANHSTPLPTLLLGDPARPPMLFIHGWPDSAALWSVHHP